MICPRETLSLFVSLSQGFVLLFGMLYVSRSMTESLIPDFTRSEKICAQFVLLLTLAMIQFHFLGVLGLFRPLPAVILTLVISVIFHRLGYSLSEFAERLWLDVRSLKIMLEQETTRLQKILLVVLGTVGIAVGIRNCILPPLAWDTLTYHAVKAAMWVQQGHVWLMNAPGGWDDYRSLPAAGEVMLAWSMLPFRADVFSGLVDFVYWCHLAVALYAVSRLLGLTKCSSLCTAAYCCFFPVVIFSVGACYVDILLALTLVIALLFVIRFVRYPSEPQSCFIAFLALGLAMSVKYTAFPTSAVMVAIVLLYSGLSIKTIGTCRPLIRWLGLGFCGMILLVLPWLVYNHFLTGNPFYPLAVKLPGISLWDSSPMMDWYQNRPEVVPYLFWTEIKALNEAFLDSGVRIPRVGVLGVIPLVLLPIGMAQLFKQNAWVGLSLLAVVGAGLGTYYSPSFSVVRILWAASSARFLLAPLFLCVVASLFAVRGLRSPIIWELLLVMASIQAIKGICIYWTEYEIEYILTISLAAILASIMLSILWMRLPRFIFGALTVMVFVIFASGLFFVRSGIRYETANKSFFFHDFPRYWVRAAEALDDPGYPRKIAVTAGPWQNHDNWFMYMFMGRSLQNRLEYVPVSVRGKLVDLRAISVSSNIADYDRWLGRLYSGGFGEIVSFSPVSVEMKWMQTHPESFEPVRDHLGVLPGVFRLRRKPASE